MSPKEVRPLEHLLATTNTERTPGDWEAAREEYKELRADFEWYIREVNRITLENAMLASENARLRSEGAS